MARLIQQKKGFVMPTLMLGQNNPQMKLTRLQCLHLRCQSVNICVLISSHYQKGPFSETVLLEHVELIRINTEIVGEKRCNKMFIQLKKIQATI